jgi:hypothetical protein
MRRETKFETRNSGRERKEKRFNAEAQRSERRGHGELGDGFKRAAVVEDFGLLVDAVDAEVD